MIRFQVNIFSNDVVFFPIHSTRRQTKPVYPMIGDTKFSHLVKVPLMSQSYDGALNEGMYPRGLVHKPYFLPISLQPSLSGKYTTFLTTLSHHQYLLVGLVVITNLRLL